MEKARAVKMTAKTMAMANATNGLRITAEHNQNPFGTYKKNESFLQCRREF
jgi:hypothetical protein